MAKKTCNHAGPCLCPQGEPGPPRIFTDSECKAKAGRLARKIEAERLTVESINQLYYPADAAVILAHLPEVADRAA